MTNIATMTDNELRDYLYEVKSELHRVAHMSMVRGDGYMDTMDELLGVMREITRETWRRWPNIAPDAANLGRLTDYLTKDREALASLSGSWRTDKIAALRLRIQGYEDKIAWINGEIR